MPKSLDATVEFVEDDQSTIVRNSENGEVHFEVKFCGAAQHLTRRAKAEIVMAAQAAYVSESVRLNNGETASYPVWNEDGTMALSRRRFHLNVSIRRR